MNGVPTKLLVIEQDASTCIQLKNQLANSQQLQVCHEVSRVEEMWVTIQTMQPDVILVGSLAGMEVGFLCQQIRFFVPHTRCIAVCTEQEALRWEAFLRNLGVPLLFKPIQPGQLELILTQFRQDQLIPQHSEQPFAYTSSINPAPTNNQAVPVQQPNQFNTDTLHPNPQAHPPVQPAHQSNEKHLITVYGPKGGVGKTFLSRELAVFYAKQQRQGQQLKVLAVDFNLDLGTIATSLNLSRTPNIYTWK